MFGKKTLADLRAVVFLHAIDRYEGKRSAAKKMDVSIDTLTKYIQGFEEECGAELLNTDGGNCRLTPRGLHFAEYAAEIERELQHMYTLVAEKDEIKGEVRLLWDHNIRANVLISDWWVLLKKHKNITIISRSFDSIANIKNFSYDIALSYRLPPGNDWELIYTSPVKSKFFASTTCLKKFGYPVDMDDMLENHRMVFKHDSDEWLKNGKFLLDRAKHKVYISDLSFTVNDAISNGVGIGVMPYSFAHSGLVCLDNIPCEIAANIYVIAHRDFKSLNRVKVVGEYIKEILKKA